MWDLLKKIIIILFQEKKELPNESNKYSVKNNKTNSKRNNINKKIKNNVKVLDKDLNTTTEIIDFEKKHVEIVLEKICVNLVYLEMLMMMLNDKPQYQRYYNQVDDMHNQSKGNIKILHRLSMQAPYFGMTFKMIIKHTMHIDKLRKSSENNI